MKSRGTLCTQAIIASNHNTDPLALGVEPEEEEVELAVVVTLVNEEMIILTFIIGIRDVSAEVEEEEEVEVAVEVVMYPAWNKNIQVSFVPCYDLNNSFKLYKTLQIALSVCTFFLSPSHTILANFAFSSCTLRSAFVIHYNFMVNHKTVLYSTVQRQLERLCFYCNMNDITALIPNYVYFT